MRVSLPLGSANLHPIPHRPEKKDGGTEDKDAGGRWDRGGLGWPRRQRWYRRRRGPHEPISENQKGDRIISEIRRNESTGVPASEIIEKIHAEMPLEPIEPNYKGEVASRYRYTDGSGEIGVIASVTQPFCGNCNRARLSTDGRLYTCLFASHSTDLRGPMRKGMSDDDLRNLIANIWNRREDRYSELRTQLTQFESLPPKIEMYQIGG